MWHHEQNKWLNNHVLVGFWCKLWKVCDSYLDACYFLCYLDQSIYICNLSHILSFKVEQDEVLEKLEETVTGTKHIALAVSEKLNLHTRLLVGPFTDVFSILFSFSWCSPSYLCLFFMQPHNFMFFHLLQYEG